MTEVRVIISKLDGEVLENFLVGDKGITEVQLGRKIVVLLETGYFTREDGDDETDI